MKLRSKQVNEVPVVELSGKLNGGADNHMLVTMVKELARGGETEIVMDLSRVRMITSTGLGLLVRARNRLERDHGRLHLCALAPRHEELLYVTQTRPLFEVHPGVEEAVAAAQLVR